MIGQRGDGVVSGNHGLGLRNEAGDRLNEFCAGNNLTIMNTWFKQPKRRLYTWTTPDGKHRNQIDYIIVKQCWKSSIACVKTFPGADCGTDHELLIAKVKIKLKRLDRHETFKRYDVDKIPSQYCVEVSNRFSSIFLEDTSPEQLWADIKTAVLLTAAKHVPKVRRKKETPWLSQIAIDIAQERREMRKKGTGREETQRLNGIFQAQARRDREEYIGRVCTEVECDKRAGKTRDLFKKIRKITGKFSPRLGSLKNEKGRSIIEGSEVKRKWREYTESLYKRNPKSRGLYFKGTLHRTRNTGERGTKCPERDQKQQGSGLRRCADRAHKGRR